jgi:hypothetical protein
LPGGEGASLPHGIAADPVNAELLKELQMCSERGTIHRSHRIHRILFSTISVIGIDAHRPVTLAIEYRLVGNSAYATVT